MLQKGDKKQVGVQDEPEIEERLWGNSGRVIEMWGKMSVVDIFFHEVGSWDYLMF